MALAIKKIWNGEFVSCRDVINLEIVYPSEVQIKEQGDLW